MTKIVMNNDFFCQQIGSWLFENGANCVEFGELCMPHGQFVWRLIVWHVGCFVAL